jgi:hypothetical protein
MKLSTELKEKLEKIISRKLIFTSSNPVKTGKYVAQRVDYRHANFNDPLSLWFEQAADNGGVMKNNMGDGRVAHVASFDCAESAASWFRYSWT